VQLCPCLFRQDSQSKGIGEDQRRLVKQLMRGAPDGDSLCGPARPPFLHDRIPRERRSDVNSTRRPQL
jgi:hypothetical protein